VAINGERDSIVNERGGKVVDETRTSVEDQPVKLVRFVGRNVIGELAFYCVGHRLHLLQAVAPKGEPRPVNFSTFLNSFRLLSRAKPQAPR
jgi:hypothetical protein